MRHVFFLGSLRPLKTALVVGVVVAAFSACSTLHESDLGANRGYNEFGTSSYKPSLAGSKKNTPASGAAKGYTKAPSRQVQYSPMVERTATGVRVVKDFTTQARGKNAKANADQVRANRAQQNARVSKANNNDNLLNR